MSEHGNPQPPTAFRYAAGIGLGVIIGGAVGLFVDEDVFLPAAVIGAAVGLLVAYFVRFTRP